MVCRFISQNVEDQRHAVEEARNAIAHFDLVRERSAALLGSKESGPIGELPRLLLFLCLKSSRLTRLTDFPDR